MFKRLMKNSLEIKKLVKKYGFYEKEEYRYPYTSSNSSKMMTIVLIKPGESDSFRQKASKERKKKLTDEQVREIKEEQIKNNWSVDTAAAKNSIKKITGVTLYSSYARLGISTSGKGGV